MDDDGKLLVRTSINGYIAIGSKFFFPVLIVVSDHYTRSLVVGICFIDCGCR